MLLCLCLAAPALCALLLLARALSPLPGPDLVGVHNDQSQNHHLNGNKMISTGAILSGMLDRRAAVEANSGSSSLLSLSLSLPPSLSSALLVAVVCAVFVGD